MLGGFVLQDAGRGHIAGLTYGARELSRDGGPAPVLRLDGLTELVKWIRTLTVLKVSGDLRPVAALLDDGGGQLVRGVTSESFGARTLDVHAAADGAHACLVLLRKREDPCPCMRDRASSYLKTESHTVRPPGRTQNELDGF